MWQIEWSDAIFIHHELHIVPLRCKFYILGDCIVSSFVENFNLNLIFIINFLVEILPHSSTLRLYSSENLVCYQIFGHGMITSCDSMWELSGGSVFNNLTNNIFFNVFCKRPLIIKSFTKFNKASIMAEYIFNKNFLLAMLGKLWPVGCHGLVVVKQPLIYHYGNHHGTNGFSWTKDHLDRIVIVALRYSTGFRSLSPQIADALIINVHAELGVMIITF